MLEFMATMAVIALVFVAATILVALVAGGLVKVRQAAMRKEVDQAETN
jgi:type III secretory pathway component EscS